MSDVKRKGRLNRRPGCRYRKCRKCGLEWNVSIKDNDRVYICPVCFYKKRKEDKKR